MKKPSKSIRLLTDQKILCIVGSWQGWGGAHRELTSNGGLICEKHITIEPNNIIFKWHQIKRAKQYRAARVEPERKTNKSTKNPSTFLYFSRFFRLFGLCVCVPH